MTCGIHAPDCIVRREPAWSAPDNSRRTAKQYAFHLPVHVAAKIAALEDIYSTGLRTPLVGDLLAAAIADVEQKLPTDPGASWGRIPGTDEELFLATGPGVTYRELADKHYEEIGRDLCNEAPSKLFSSTLMVDADGK